MVARSRARYLAPLALAATLAGTYLVVHAAVSAKHQNQTSSARSHGPANKFSQTKFYVVQQGDSLTSIAAKTHIQLTKLEELNPSVDPNTLQTGRRLRLRR
ncbi:MAG: LysM peptidoglycan-binding domain-containing protein [Solirubrobacterales bacterium]|nr:LysM peptidoglycan-binding domain-containing protein [Solirubrobacterales bacterium]